MSEDKPRLIGSTHARAHTLGSPTIVYTAPPANDTAKHASVIDDELDEWALAQPTVTRCAWCEWTFEGTVQDGRDAHVEHRQAAHNKPAEHRRRQRRRRFMEHDHNRLEANIANARAAGAAQGARNTYGKDAA